MDSLELEVYSIIAERVWSYDGIVDGDVRFEEDMGADSVEMLDVILECERRFNMVFTGNEELSLKTAGDLVELIRSKER